MTDKFKIDENNNQGKTLIVKHNRLVEASYYLTLAEIRLLNLVFAEITENPNGSNDFWFETEFTVTAEKYSEVYGLDISTAYNSLQEASQKLFNRYVKYEGEGYGKNTDFVEIIESRWVSEIRYSKQGGYVTLILTGAVMSLVGIMPAPFTQAYLEHTAGLTSIYAKRIYEFMVQWRGGGCKTPKITVGDLKRRLGIEQSQYQQMNNFKRIVLDVAIEQINEHTDIIASYEQIKQGRTIIAFIFRFKDKNVIEGKSKLKDKEKSDIALPPPPETPSDDLTDIQKQALADVNKYIADNNITAPAKIENLRKMALDGRWKLKTAQATIKPKSKFSEPIPQATATNLKFKGMKND